MQRPREMLKTRIAHLELRTELRIGGIQLELRDSLLSKIFTDPHAENRARRFIAPLAVESRRDHVGVAVRLKPRMTALVAQAARPDRRTDMHAYPVMFERRHPVQSRRDVNQFRTKALPAERFA